MPNSSGVVRTDPMNRTNGKHVHNYSTFKDSLSYKLANTLRFGDLTPSFVMDSVPKDEISLNSKDMIDSLSLKAPFKGSIRKIKDTFSVPDMAILPMNWDLIYTQPSNGDDVPTIANCVLLKFPSVFKTYWSNLWNVVFNNIPSSSSTATDVCKWLTALCRTLVVGEYVYSHGSLLNVCGYKASSQFYHTKLSVAGGYDEFFDKIISDVFSNFKSFQIKAPYAGVDRVFVFKGLASGSVYTDDQIGSFRACLELFRENPLAYFDYADGGANLEFDTNLASFILIASQWSTNDIWLLSNIKFFIPAASTDGSLPDFDDELNVNNLNLKRLLAYQIACAHYYTNSSVDVVYSAELYRTYIRSLLQYSLNNAWNELTVCFSFNGRYIPYDYLSGALLRSIFLDSNSSWNPWSVSINFLSAEFTTTYTNADRVLAGFALMSAIFGFRKSLRYGDYFVGSRPRPLAPINTDVSVNSNKVSVIDITKAQWAQKFGNAVMRSRQKIEEYVKDLFGDAPAPDFHNPFFLASESELIFGDEVQNTADTQVTDANSRTSNFASNMNQFTFTFHNDDNHPCTYLQIISFDIKRFYTRSVERQFLQLDRYDMFNPDFQYIGDQPVYGIELGYPQTGYLGSTTLQKVFSYQSRDMEYKQRFDQACGGFNRELPGWILTDLDRSGFSYGYLDSDFIRSYNTELDQFFLSLTGYSLASYFHFICITNNFVNAKRPMAVDPQILG